MLRWILESSTMVAATAGMLSVFSVLGAFDRFTQAIPKYVLGVAAGLLGAAIGFLAGRLSRTEKP
jgi:xanthine/uracil permease